MQNVDVCKVRDCGICRGRTKELPLYEDTCMICRKQSSHNYVDDWINGGLQNLYKADMGGEHLMTSQSLSQIYLIKKNVTEIYLIF